MKVDLYDVDCSNISDVKLLVDVNQNGFMLCTNGSIKVEMEEKSYTLERNDLFVLPAFAITEITWVSHDMRGLVGMADFDFVLNMLEQAADTPVTVHIRFNPFIHVSASRSKRLQQVADMLRRRSEQTSKFAPIITNHYINILCYEIVEAFAEDADFMQLAASQTRKDKVFQAFITDLFRNARTCRDVRFYADRQCLTPRYFATIVSLRSGLTPLQWIAMFVVNEAKHLLHNPKMSIKEVAERLNFSDQSLFCRYFKKHAGITPGNYRRH